MARSDLRMRTEAYMDFFVQNWLATKPAHRQALRNGHREQLNRLLLNVGWVMLSPARFAQLRQLVEAESAVQQAEALVQNR